MKKTISILLALILVVSLCSCGKKLETFVVGTWEGERKVHTDSLNYDVGDIQKITLEFYADGNGVVKYKNLTSGEGNVSKGLKWEIDRSNILRTEHDNNGRLITESFEINTKKDELTRNSDHVVLYRVK